MPCSRRCASADITAPRACDFSSICMARSPSESPPSRKTQSSRAGTASAKPTFTKHPFMKLEWATSSPPPAFNFAVLPHVEGEDAYWAMKQRARRQAKLGEEPGYTAIEMPRNSPTGFICAFFATVMGFALIWHIWWMVALAALGAYATFVAFAWRDRVEYVIPAETVARIDRANRSARSQALVAMQAAP